MPMPAKALWDTGHHGDGKSTRNTYIVNFGLPNGVLVAGILATEFPASHTQFSAIIGMDVICLGDFAITNANGRSTISFRVPACEEIDYVLEAHRLTFRGTPRNAPCPCGSGQKFKHCHIDSI